MKKSTLLISYLVAPSVTINPQLLGHLKRHEKSHTVKKPHSCSQCDYKCSQSSHLMMHEKMRNDDKPLSCSQCDHKCSQSSLLKTHEKSAMLISLSVSLQWPPYLAIERDIKKYPPAINHSAVPSVV